MAQIEQVRRLNYNGEDIGMGFNSDTGLGVGTALTFTPPNATASQEATAEITIVTSHDQLMSALHMSADLEGRYAFVSAGGKIDFARNTQYNSMSTFVVARMVITNTVQRGSGFTLRPEMRHLLETNQEDVFNRAFGDSFVRAHYDGGEFYAVMRLTSVDSKTETKLAASLHAEFQGGASSGAFKSALDIAKTNEATRSDFSVKFYQKGGLGGDEIGTALDIDAIKLRLKTFPEAVKNHPFPYFIEVATYDTLPLPLPTKQQQEAFLLALHDADAKKLKYLEARNDCEFAAEHPEYFFQPPGRPMLLAMAETYLQLVNAVLDHSVRLSNGQINPPQFFDPGKLTPPLSEPEIILRKRDIGLEAGFADWWVDKDKPDSRHADRDLVVDIGYLAMEQINDFNAIADPDRDPVKTLRLQGEALARIVASLRAYDWNHAGMHAAARGALDSLAKLSTMLPTTIASLSFARSGLASIEGLEQFATLAELDLSQNQIAALDGLHSLTGLRTLLLGDNRVTSLEPLRGCTGLEKLDISANAIADLGPLADCKSLRWLVTTASMFSDGGGATRSGNPIRNARGLGTVPALANPFTLGDVLAVRYGILRDGPAKQFTGTATRIGDSLDFHARLQRAGDVLDAIWSLGEIAPIDPDQWDQEFLQSLVPEGVSTAMPAIGSRITLMTGPAYAPQGPGPLCYVNPADPSKAVLDPIAYPVAAFLPYRTLDVSVVSSAGQQLIAMPRVRGR